MSQAQGRPDYVDVYRQVLDHALVDADDWLCGIVDDVEVDGGIGEPLRITALLVGPGAWASRLPPLFARLVPYLFGTRCVRVPWSEVSVLGEQIQLCSRAATLGLATTDRRLGLYIARLPGSDRSGK